MLRDDLGAVWSTVTWVDPVCAGSGRGGDVLSPDHFGASGRRWRGLIWWAPTRSAVVVVLPDHLSTRSATAWGVAGMQPESLGVASQEQRREMPLRPEAVIRIPKYGAEDAVLADPVDVPVVVEQRDEEGDRAARTAPEPEPEAGRMRRTRCRCGSVRPGRPASALASNTTTRNAARYRVTLLSANIRRSAVASSGQWLLHPWGGLDTQRVHAPTRGDGRKLGRVPAILSYST
jgi:hypothetical protein